MRTERFRGALLSTLVIASLMVLLILLMATSPALVLASDTDQQIVVNGDFSTGNATGWGFGFAAEPPYGSEPTYEIVNYTARIYRTGAGTTGRGAWLYQEPNAYVGDASELTLSFRVKVDYQSLTSGDSNREFTADVIVRYVDVNGNPSVFERGFFYAGPNTHENAENIPQSTWVQRSYDLASLSPKPATIQEVLLNANGWDYDVSFDDASLIYKTPTGISTGLIIGIAIIIGCVVIIAALYMRRRKPTEFRW